jgi:hypothetical protein
MCGSWIMDNGSWVLHRLHRLEIDRCGIEREINIKESEIMKYACFMLHGASICEMMPSCQP